MSAELQKAVFLFKEKGIVSKTMSLQFEEEYPISQEVASLEWHHETLSRDKCKIHHPQLWTLVERKSLQRAAMEIEENEPWAFELDTSFFSRNIKGTSATGLVLILPPAFEAELPNLLNQKPTEIYCRSICRKRYMSYFRWKVGQGAQTSTHDLLLPTFPSSIMSGRLEATTGPAVGSIQTFWSDVVIVSGNNVGIGGFYYSLHDIDQMQATGHGTVNYNPLREFTCTQLDYASICADIVGSPTPWHTQVCINEEGHRYKAIPTI